MPVNKKSFKTLEPIYFETPDKDTEMVKNTFSTSQGLTLNKYKLLENLNDLKVKNYSVNILTDEIDFNEFYTYDLGKKFEFLDFNTSIMFNALNGLSGSSFLQFERTRDFNNSGVNLDFYTGGADQSFVLDFKDEKFCSIKGVDNGIIKFLTVLEDKDNDIKFSELTTDYETNSCSLFEYDFDNSNLFITLFKTLTGGDFKVLSPLSASLSLFTPTNTTVGSAVIKISDQQYKITKDDLNSFIFYDKDKKISGETLKNRKNNYIGWFPYETTSLSGNPEENQSQRFINFVDFMSLRNQVSNDNFVNTILPLSGNETSQKKYSSLLNVDNKEFENEEMLLGYNFYTKEYNFLPDKNTKFTLPDSLFPYTRLNINDSNFSKAGSHASNSPYFSDKVFKLLDANKNKNRGAGDLNNLFELQTERKTVIRRVRVGKRGTIVNKEVKIYENEGGFLLTQDGFRLGNEDYNDPSEADNNGSLLCSWLSGDEDKEGVWFDRYYNPQKVSYFGAITGVNTQAFDRKSQAKKYFLQNGINSVYYDVKSNLVFEPKSSYFYQRIGNKYINEIIDGLNYRILKDTFNVKLSGQELLNENTLIFDKKGYDITDFDLIKLKDFNISFDLNLDKLNSLDTYQMLGNLYEDGFSLKNNFYFTPFIFLPHGNVLSIYDKDFNLITENTYASISAIKDVLYLEQHNNIVIIGDDRILKTSFTGELIDQRLKDTVLFGDSTINTIISSYDNRYFHGYNNVLFKTRGSEAIQNLDLVSLSLSSSIHGNLSSGSSIIEDVSGNFISLSGFKGKYLNDSIGVSITDKNNILYQDIAEKVDLGYINTDKHIYDFNTYDEKLYVQSFNNTSNSGFIHIFSSERELLSTINLSTSAVSGANLDFINDNGDIKLLSFGKNTNGNLIIDKINLDNPVNNTRTYFLPLTTQDLNHDLYQGNFYYNPVNFQSLYYKHRERQNKLNFVVGLDSFVGSNINTNLWNETNPALTGRFTSPANDLSGWGKTFSTTNIDGLESQEKFIELKDLKLKNDISLNFKLNDGLIEVFLNGKFVDDIKFTPNASVLEKLIFPDIFYNTPNIKNNPIFKLINTEQYYGKGGSISNFKLYNNIISDDFIKFLHLKDKKIDNLNFDITSGTRNNIEEMNNIYNVNLPGIKNNNIKIYVKNANLSKEDKVKFENFLNNKIKKVLPSNIDTIKYDFDVNF